VSGEHPISFRLKNLKILPFNLDHAKRAGEFARILHEAKKNKQIDVSERSIIINDAKLFAQADTELQIKYFVTSDQESMKLLNTLRSKINPKFEIVDITIDCNERFGLLNLQ